MPSVWPLVGRRRELATLERALRTRSSDTRGVVLAGEAGVGKTRLASEGLSIARSSGRSASWAIGTKAARSIPFGAMSHLLPERLPAASDRVNVLRVAADSLLEGPDAESLVLGIDDAHLLDDHSAALLHHLILSEKTFLILAVRTGEPTPDPIVDLWKDGTCERLELQPLSRSELQELVERVLGSQVDGPTGHRLWELTRGNPLFLREVVLGALEEGSLTETDGLWRWRGDLSTLPRLRDVIGSRLKGLSPDEREALEVVAFGEPLELEILHALTTPEIVDRMERRGLLEETGQGRRAKMRPSHPLYGEIVRADTPPARARAIRHGMADALARTGTRRSRDLLRVATWRLDAGTSGSPPEYLEAARDALELFDHPLAERLARAAAERAADSGAWSSAAVVLAGALMRQARFQEAEDLLAEVMAKADDELQRVEAALARCHNLFWDLGRGEEALRVLEDAEGGVSDATLRDDLAAAHAYQLTLSGRFDEGISSGLAILDRPTNSARAAISAVGAGGQGLSYTGRPVAALDLLDRHLDAVIEALALFLFGPIAVIAYRTPAYLFSGRLIQGLEEADRTHREALIRGPDWVAGFAAGTLGVLQAAQGRIESAGKSLREAAVLVREADIGGQASVFTAELARCLALLGEPARAEEMLRQAEARRLPAHRILDGWFLLPRAWIAAAHGHTSAAIAEAMDAADSLGSLKLRSQQAIALHDAVRLGEARMVAEPLERLAEGCDGEIVPAFARHAKALVEGDAPALDQLSADFESMGARLFAAEASAEAARRHRRLGNRGSAAAAASRARSLVARCEGVRTPALADLDEALPLTRREREVATLAARGLTNKQIAERLVVSERTVGNHLYNVYAKLGVNGRDDLRRLTELRS